MRLKPPRVKGGLTQLPLAVPRHGSCRPWHLKLRRVLQGDCSSETCAACCRETPWLLRLVAGGRAAHVTLRAAQVYAGAIDESFFKQFGTSSR